MPEYGRWVMDLNSATGSPLRDIDCRSSSREKRVTVTNKDKMTFDVIFSLLSMLWDILQFLPEMLVTKVKTGLFFAVDGLARREPEKRQNPKVISTVNFWF